ncbi:MAG: rhodanese-like domain-containing protein [Alphaproteobacteria bacterium]|jgi:rhodanese-related sulfurtransferase
MCSAYAGDLSPAEAWDLLSQNQQAVLVDVRTQPEWGFVGLPDLSLLGRAAALASWQVYPTMEINSRFQAEIAEAAPNKDVPILLICRSGARSRSAAVAATAMGYATAHNVAEGFEGDLSANGRRGESNGWKVAGLPWRQG